MSDIIVIGYPDADTAEAARDEIFGMAPKDQLSLSQLSEAVVATRRAVQQAADENLIESGS